MASTMMVLGRGTVLAMGLAVLVGLAAGLVSAVLAGNGDPLRLGRSNAATNVTQLAGRQGVDGPMLRIVNNNDGANDTALELRVDAGEPPLVVNSAAEVSDLNADLVDGKDSSQIGTNGVVLVAESSATNSDNVKTEIATCPDGKVAVGGGARVQGEIETVALQESHQHFEDQGKWQASARAINSTGDIWKLETYAVCVVAGDP